MRYYNIDLNYVHNNDLISFRKFLVLIRGLPETSAYARFLNNKENRNFLEMSENDIQI